MLNELTISPTFQDIFFPSSQAGRGSYKNKIFKQPCLSQDHPHTKIQNEIFTSGQLKQPHSFVANIVPTSRHAPRRHCIMFTYKFYSAWSEYFVTLVLFVIKLPFVFESVVRDPDF